MKTSGICCALAAGMIGMTVSSAASAAENPFAEVPENHWAYDAVRELAADGVLEGYGDGSLLGERRLTRYEMAQAVARAMTKEAGLSKEQRGRLEKLQAEYREELKNLGVSVTSLEKHADKVKWGGKLVSMYHHYVVGHKNDDGQADTDISKLVLRLEPQAEIGGHWKLRSRISAKCDVLSDSAADLEITWAWAEGRYENFLTRLGRVWLYTNERGLLWDTEMMGGDVSFGGDWRLTVGGGRLSKEKTFAAVREAVGDVIDYRSAEKFFPKKEAAAIYGLNLQYDHPAKSKLYGGLGYYHIKDADLMDGYYTTEGDEDTADIWSVNAGYRFTPKFKLLGAYARNLRADFENRSWQLEADYGGEYSPAKQGSWYVYAGYREQGGNTSFMATQDEDMMRGTRGWVCGASWAPIKNIGFRVKYFNGETITGERHAQHFFGNVQIFF